MREENFPETYHAGRNSWRRLTVSVEIGSSVGPGWTCWRPETTSWSVRGASVTGATAAVEERHRKGVRLGGEHCHDFGRISGRRTRRRRSGIRVWMRWKTASRIVRKCRRNKIWTRMQKKYCWKMSDKLRLNFVHSAHKPDSLCSTDWLICLVH